MVTVAEDTAKKIARLADWKKANPKQWEKELAVPEGDDPLYISRQQIESAAFRSLSKNALQWYMMLLTKRQVKPSGRKKRGQRRRDYYIANNGQIIFPYSEASEQLKLSRQQIRNAIDELQAKGFIDAAHWGTGGKKPKDGTGDCTLFCVDSRWRKYDPDLGASTQPPRNPRPKDRRNLGFALLNKDPERRRKMAERRKQTIRNRSGKTNIGVKIHTPLPVFECEKTHSIST